MGVDTRKIACSLEQLHTVLQSVLFARQQELTRAASRTRSLVAARQVVIVDQERQHGDLIARELASAGYRPQVTCGVVEAYTLFLGGKLFPLALILLGEESSDRFFLQRLTQHMLQKYSWDVPLIQVTAPPRAQLAEPATTPLPQYKRLTQRLPESTDKPGTKQLPRISLEGQSLGRYHILARLGYDGSSDVYRAYDRLREYDVAFKALPTSPQDFEEAGEKGHIFQHEHSLLEPFNHPHILPLFNCGKSYISGSPFFYKTMPYCQEGSLAAWRFQHGGSRPFAPRDVAAIVVRIAETLHYLHGQNITYGNFKLSNILISNQADDLRHLNVMLVDFMVPFDEAKMLESMLYMAPERWYGYTMPASDQYGLAALAYELLTGRPLFPGNSQQIVQRMHQSFQPHPASAFNPAVDRALDNALLSALAKRPQDRFRSITEFARAFERCGQM